MGRYLGQAIVDAPPQTLRWPPARIRVAGTPEELVALARSVRREGR